MRLLISAPTAQPEEEEEVEDVPMAVDEQQVPEVRSAAYGLALIHF